MLLRTFLPLALLLLVAGCEEPAPEPEVNSGSNGDAVVTLTDANFESVVLNSAEPVLVDFSATWCGPCQQMAPIVDAIATEYQGKATVATIDIDDNPMMAQKYKAEAIPLFVIFKNGEEVERIVGAGSKETLTRPLDAALQAG